MADARDWIERSRGRIVVVLVLIVGLYFVVAFGEQAWKARELEAEVAEREATIARMEARRAALQAQVEEYTSDRYLDYVERTARRDLNLSRPGETVLLVRWLASPTPTPSPDPTAGSPQLDPPNWRKWLAVFGLDPEPNAP